MLDYLRRLAARVLTRMPPLDLPGDPDTAVREPRRRNPAGRGSAVAVEEPDPPVTVRAVSSSKIR